MNPLAPTIIALALILVASIAQLIGSIREYRATK
jgi:hypothetical protein